MDVSLPYGQGELTFSLPEHWTLQQLAKPEIKPAPADWPDRLAACLAQPGTGLPLDKLLAARRGGRIALIVEDITRHSPLPEILAVVMREIRHAQIPDEQIEVVFATGMHPPMTAEQAAAKLGPDAASLRWRCNASRAPKTHAHIGQVGKLSVSIDSGVASADLRIVISSVSPHLQAGFGGGYKMLLPGCSSLETIRGLHRLGFGPSAQQLVGTEAERNAMRSAIDAAGELIDSKAGKTFAIQYVLDDKDLPTFIAAGDMIPTQQMLAKQCAVSCGIITPSAADVLIANAYPRDYDLWQSFKCIANTIWAARPDGVVICLTHCQGGLNGVNASPWPLSPTWTRRIIRAIGPDALGTLVTRLVPRLAGDAAFFVRAATQIFHRNPILLVSDVLHAQKVQFPGLRIFGTIEQAMAAADAMLGRKPQRVTVFSSGGITYPIPTMPLSERPAETPPAANR